MMSLPEIAIRRPVMTVLLSLSVIVAGLAAFRLLPIAALPNIDTPTISVSAVLPGASAETMASSVATPLERQLSTIAGVTAINSTSTLGNTSINVEFAPDRNIDAAAVDVQAALLRAQKSLPVEMTTLPSYRKINPADTPVVVVSISSPSLSLSDLNDYVEHWISPTLSTMPGVAQVMMSGQKKFAVRIKADPQKLAARNLSLDELAAAVNAANSNAPVGRLDSAQQGMVIEANRQLASAAEFADIIVDSSATVPVRLRDVATVEDSVENVRVGSWVNGERSIVLLIMRQPGGNIVEMVDAIRAGMPKLLAQMPESVKVQFLNDRSLPIRTAIHDVGMTLLLTLALVVLVIFLFLRRAVATFIPAVSLPISLLATVALMYPLGYSLDNISLIGITLAVGLVVDDAIVVLENIVRHIENGESVLEAARRGAREVSFTIVSISVSLVAIFIPLFFMQGVIGMLFHEFAVVVSLAVLVSALVSLTVIPLLSSWLLKRDSLPVHGEVAAREWSLSAGFERGFAVVARFYARTLDVALRWQRSMLLLALGTFAATAWLYLQMPSGFFPVEDNGQFMASTEARQDISYDAMVALQKQVADILQADPAVATVTSAVGTSDNGVANSRLFVSLKPRGQRPPIEQVLEGLRKKLQVPGISVFLTPTQNIRLGSKLTKSRYQYMLQSVRANELNEFSEKLRAALQADSLFRDVTSDVQFRSLQARVDIDRDKASRLGVSIASVRSALYSAFGDRQVGSIYTGSDTYQVILTVNDDDKTDEYDVLKLRVRAKSGELVPLASFVRVDRGVGPTAVNHQGQLQAVTLSFNLAPGVALSEADTRMKQIQQELQMPAAVIGQYYGDAAAFQQSQGSQLLLLLAAIVVIYVLLGILYESYIHPLTILSGLPSAAIGALLTLMFFHKELTLIAMIGVLMLIGIVKKNAIMMIDFAIDAQRSQQLSPQDAIRAACVLRFRPIMMTTLAAMMGALPIALGLGAGAELRQPLGLTVVGGLLFSQVITLYITPVIYLWFERLRELVTARQTQA